MALPAARLPRSPADRGAILETAYAQARRIAFGRWLGQIDQSEIEALVGAAVLKLLDGEAEVIDTPDAIEPLVEYYRNIAGEHPDWDQYREAMRKQGKSLIRVTPLRWGPVATGGFPARLTEGGGS